MGVPTVVGSSAIYASTGSIGPPGSGATLATLAAPTHQADDVLWLQVQTQAGTSKAVLTTANGFDLVDQSADSGAADNARSCKMAVYWKRATGAGSTLPTVADSGDHNICRIIVTRGNNTSDNPWDVKSTGVKATASTAVSAAGSDTTVTDTLTMLFLGADQDSTAAIVSAGAYSNATLTSLTVAWDEGTATNNGGQEACVHGSKTGIGSTGTFTATSAISSKNAWVIISAKSTTSSSGAVNIKPNFLMFM